MTVTAAAGNLPTFGPLVQMCVDSNPTNMAHDHSPDPTFVAPGRPGSRHNSSDEDDYHLALRHLATRVP